MQSLSTVRKLNYVLSTLNDNESAATCGENLIPKSIYHSKAYDFDPNTSPEIETYSLKVFVDLLSQSVSLPGGTPMGPSLTQKAFHLRGPESFENRMSCTHFRGTNST